MEVDAYDDSDLPDHIYLNMSAAAGVYTSSVTTQPIAQTSDQRNMVIVTDLQLYKLAVIRCSISSRSLPIFIPSIKTGQPDPWLTNYNLTLNLTNTQPGSVPLAAPGVYTLWLRESVDWTRVDVDTSTPGFNMIAALAAALPPNYTAELNSAGTLTLSNSLYPFSATVNADSYSGQPPYVQNASTFGFLYLPNLITPAPALLLNSQLDTGTGVNVIHFPNPPQYNTPVSQTFTATTYLRWLPQTQNIPTPQSPMAAQQSSMAYWMYDYQWFVNIFNTAVQGAWGVLQSQYTSSHPTSPPRLQYNGTTKTFSVAGDALLFPSVGQTFAGQLNNVYSMSLTLNEMLSDLLCLPAVYDAFGNATLNFSNALISQPFTINGVQNWVVLNNDYSPVGAMWSPVQSIVFTAARWNARPELTSLVTNVGADTAGASASSVVNYNTFQILTDIVANNTDAAQYRSETTIFVPSGVLRFTDLYGIDSLIGVDLEVCWKNRLTGEILPIRLNPLAGFEAKFLLQKKRIQGGS